MNHNIVSCRDEEMLQEQIRNGETVLALVQVPRDERHLNDKSHVLCSLKVSQSKDISPKLYFDLHHKRFYYSPNDKQQQQQQQVYCGGPTLHTSVLIPNLICSPGLVTKSELRQAKERFGAYNKLTLSPPTIQAAFVSRISSPLSVLQLVGKFLSALEEDFKSSILSLATTLIHHYWNARTSIVSATELSKEVGDSVTSASRECVWALRPNKKQTTSWKRIPAVELLPGDIFVMNSTSSTTMPVDALLLEGTCVMNEAILTGESISQTKWTLNAADEQDATFLDMTGAHRHSVLFAGTSLLYCTNSHVKRENHIPKLPKACSSGCRFLALRTGSYSSRGELLRALLARNSNHVGAISNPQTERDALRLIASLSCFAALACASLFYGQGNVKTSSFRRVIQCTRIAVASIPSDLPLALSSVAHSCSVRLRQEADVVCSEPGSLLTAAHVGTVVFDKTGTLTADTQALSQVVKPKGVTSAVVDMDEVILAGCHSLVDVNTTTNEQQIAGDPLDLASLQYTGWTYDRKYDSYQRKVPKGKDGPIKLWQLKTFPFDATRRTSSALILVLYADGKCRLWKTIKGSPDCISIIVDPTHEQWYNAQMRKLGGKGLRTIAMAATDVTTANDTFTTSLFPGGLPDITTASDEEFQEMIISAREKAGSLHRIDFEGFDNDWTAKKSHPSFELVGFACFDAAVRPSTRRVVQELKAAQVNVIMLTGDGVDAAISVADTAGLLSNTDSIAVLDIVSSLNGSSLVWRMIRKTNSKTKKLSSFKSLDTFNLSSDSVERMLCNSEKGDCSLVVTGKAAELLLSTSRTTNSRLYSRLRDNLDHFTIFARASPKQKKSIVSNLKEHHSGTKKVLMCGMPIQYFSFCMRVLNICLAHYQL
jgi:cation-transporting ATPase 13A1